MRSFWVGLVVFAVLFAGLIGSRSEAGKRNVKPATKAAAPANQPPDREEDVVTGYGVDAAKAVDQAVAKAQERVRGQLAEELGSAWHSNEDVLDPKYLESMGVIRPVGDPVALTLKDGDWLVAKVHVRLTPPYLKAVSRFARHQHMGDRHLIAARVLAGMVALLLVVTGYLRLEELTRGYATTMLRAAAAAVLLMVGLGLWVTA